MSVLRSRLGEREVPGHDEGGTKEGLKQAEPLAGNKGKKERETSPVPCLQVEQRCLGVPAWPDNF